MLRDQTFDTQLPILALGPEFFFDANDPTRLALQTALILRQSVVPARLFQFGYVALTPSAVSEPRSQLESLSKLGLSFWPILVLNCERPLGEEAAAKTRQWLSLMSLVYSPEFSRRYMYSYARVFNGAAQRLLERLMEFSLNPQAFNMNDFLTQLHGH